MDLPTSSTAPSRAARGLATIDARRAPLGADPRTVGGHAPRHRPPAARPARLHVGRRRAPSVDRAGSRAARAALRPRPEPVRGRPASRRGPGRRVGAAGPFRVLRASRVRGAGGRSRDRERPLRGLAGVLRPTPRAGGAGGSADRRGAAAGRSRPGAPSGAPLRRPPRGPALRLRRSAAVHQSLRPRAPRGRPSRREGAAATRGVAPSLTRSARPHCRCAPGPLSRGRPMAGLGRPRPAPDGTRRSRYGEASVPLERRSPCRASSTSSSSLTIPSGR